MEMKIPKKPKIKAKKKSKPQSKTAKLELNNIMDMSDEEILKLISKVYVETPLVAHACFEGDTCGRGCGVTSGPGTTYGCCG